MLRRTFGMLCLAVVGLLVLSPACDGQAPAKPAVERVILVSIDGLRPDVIAHLGPEKTPTLHRLMKEGAFTLNARTDAQNTSTIPNHTCMITSRPLRGEAGHHYSNNDMPRTSLHKEVGRRIHSVFDVVAARGGTSGLFAAKSKFVLYDMTWGAAAVEARELDRRVIERTFITELQDRRTLDAMLEYFKEHKPTFIFLHLGELDKVGHQKTWDWNGVWGKEYLVEVQRQDALLGEVFKAIEDMPQTAKSTAVIVTTDHGGTRTNHGDPRDPLNYIIPFFVWGPGVQAGADLYALNRETRRDPERRHIDNDAELQPIRSADAGNLALQLLGMPTIEGSVFNAKQDLRLAAE